MCGCQWYEVSEPIPDVLRVDICKLVPLTGRRLALELEEQGCGTHQAGVRLQSLTVQFFTQLILQHQDMVAEYRRLWSKEGTKSSKGGF